MGDALLAFAATTGVTPDEVRDVVLGFVRDSLTFGVLGVVRQRRRSGDALRLLG